MLRRVFVVTGMSAALLMSCGTEESSVPVNKEPLVADSTNVSGTSEAIYNDDPSTSGQARNLSTNEGIQPTVAEVISRADSVLKADPVLKKEHNTTSVYKYLTTSPEYSIIGKLVNASSFTKTLHHDRITFFAPSDDKWDADLKKSVMEFVEKNNRPAVDRYLGQYFIKRQVDPSKLEETEKIGDQNGNAMVFDYDEILYVNGLVAELIPISTLNGFVVDLEAPFPLMD